jgi:hypothetical protein
MLGKHLTTEVHPRPHLFSVQRSILCEIIFFLPSHITYQLPRDGIQFWDSESPAGQFQHCLRRHLRPKGQKNSHFPGISPPQATHCSSKTCDSSHREGGCVSTAPETLLCRAPPKTHSEHQCCQQPLQILRGREILGEGTRGHRPH